MLVLERCFLKPLKTLMRIMCIYTLKLQVPYVDLLIAPIPQLISLIQEKMPNFTEIPTPFI
jgi:hypothetical protein